MTYDSPDTLYRSGAIGLPMTTRFITLEHGRLAVEVDGDGPLVICSPALGDVRDAYDPLTDRLVAGGYRVARVDLRGHGESTASFSRYGDEASAEDLLAVADELDEKSVVLVGASMSAAAAVIAAGRRPAQVCGLVLIAPFLRNGASDLSRWMVSLALARPWGPYLWRAHASQLWPGLGAGARERAVKTTTLLTRPGRWAAFRATLHGADHRAVTPWFGSVQAPVLIVMGDADPDWKEPLAEARWAASRFSHAEILAVPAAGHAPMLERPDIVAPTVLRYLTTLRDRRS